MMENRNAPCRMNEATRTLPLQKGQRPPERERAPTTANQRHTQIITEPGDENPKLMDSSAEGPPLNA